MSRRCAVNEAWACCVLAEAVAAATAINSRSCACWRLPRSTNKCRLFRPHLLLALRLRPTLHALLAARDAAKHMCAGVAGRAQGRGFGPGQLRYHAAQPVFHLQLLLLLLQQLGGRRDEPTLPSTLEPRCAGAAATCPVGLRFQASTAGRDQQHGNPCPAWQCCEVHSFVRAHVYGGRDNGGQPKNPAPTSRRCCRSACASDRCSRLAAVSKTGGDASRCSACSACCGAAALRSTSALAALGGSACGVGSWGERRAAERSGASQSRRPRQAKPFHPHDPAAASVMAGFKQQTCP